MAPNSWSLYLYSLTYADAQGTKYTDYGDVPEDLEAIAESIRIQRGLQWYRIVRLADAKAWVTWKEAR